MLRYSFPIGAIVGGISGYNYFAFMNPTMDKIKRRALGTIYLSAGALAGYFYPIGIPYSLIRLGCCGSNTLDLSNENYNIERNNHLLYTTVRISLGLHFVTKYYIRPVEIKSNGKITELLLDEEIDP